MVWLLLGLEEEIHRPSKPILREEGRKGTLLPSIKIIIEIIKIIIEILFKVSDTEMAQSHLLCLVL